MGPLAARSAAWRAIGAPLESSRTVTTVQDNEHDNHVPPLDTIAPLVIIDGEGRIQGVVLPQSALAPPDLYERLCERAESWLASRAGAKLRAQAPASQRWCTSTPSQRARRVRSPLAGARGGAAPRARASPCEDVTPSLLNGLVIVSPDHGGAPEHGNRYDHCGDDQPG